MSEPHVPIETVLIVKERYVSALIKSETALPKEVVLLALLVLVSKFADEAGMDIQLAFRDVLKHYTREKQMEAN